MTYDSGTPATSDSPGELPTQNQNNWKRLKAIISTDHQFNDPGGSSTFDGYHKIIQLDPQSAPGATAGLAKLYARTSANIVPYYRYPDSGAGAIPEAWVPTVVAAGRFTGNSGPGAHTPIGQTHNCTAKTTSGAAIDQKTEVTFTTPLPDANYFYQVQRADGSSVAITDITASSFKFNKVNSSKEYTVLVFYLPPA